MQQRNKQGSKLRRYDDMATLQVTFQSSSLVRNTTISAVVPLGSAFPGGPAKLPFKALYLLHGYVGDNSHWLENGLLEELALRYNMAIIMPSGENSFYTDWEPSNYRFSTFIGKELVDFTRNLLHLSDKREDTLIAGLSMGGYGALYNGLRHYETFGHVIALSSALIYDNAKNSTNEPNMMGVNRSYMEMVFGNLDKIDTSECTIPVLAERVNAEAAAKKLPLDLYIACGWNDQLVFANRELAKKLKKLTVNHTYEEGPGTHEWPFWRNFLRSGLEHVFPPAPGTEAPPPMPFWIEKPGEFSYD
jgi:S-formylglutathione hydrolase FrmB